MTNRWTDAMLDELSNSVKELSGSVKELKGSVKELKESIQETNLNLTQVSHKTNMLIGAVNALIERDEKQQAEFQAYKQETDRRFAEQNQRIEAQNKHLNELFYSLLEEVRFLGRRMDEKP